MLSGIFIAGLRTKHKTPSLKLGTIAQTSSCTRQQFTFIRQPLSLFQYDITKLRIRSFLRNLAMPKGETFEIESVYRRSSLLLTDRQNKREPHMQ